MSRASSRQRSRCAWEVHDASRTTDSPRSRSCSGAVQQLAVGRVGPLRRCRGPAPNPAAAGVGRVDARPVPCGCGRWRARRHPNRSASSPARVVLPVPGQAADQHQAHAPARRCRSARSACSARRPRRRRCRPGRGAGRRPWPGRTRGRRCSGGEEARGRVGGELDVGLEEALGELGRAEPLEVHGQEGDVVQHVDVAQPVVELEAVEHPGSVGEAEDVLGEEVPVPVDDRARGDPVGEQAAPAVEEPARPAGRPPRLSRRPAPRRGTAARRRCCPPTALAARHGRPRRRSRGRGRRPRGRRPSAGPARAGARPRRRRPGPGSPAADLPASGASRGHARPDRRDGRRPGNGRDVGQSEVDVRGEPPVEPQLALEGGEPLLRVLKSRNAVRTGFLSL